MKNKHGGTSRETRRTNVFASSVILSALVRFSSYICKKLSSGFFAGIFTAYDRESKAISESLTARGIDKLDAGTKVAMPVKHRIAKWAEESTIIGGIKKVLFGLLSCPMKSYGIFLFSFAFYSAILYLFRTFYISKEPELDAVYIITVAAMFISSVAMLISRHSLGSALRSSPMARFILFRVIGLRTNSLDGADGGGSKFHIAFFFGLLFGIASYAVHPLLLLIGVMGLVAAYLVLIKPELGVVAIITALPFLPTMVLVAAVLYTALCYTAKLIVGRRSLKFDLLDGVVLIFMLLMIGGGIISVKNGSLKPMLVYVAFMIGYFLTVNLIRSGEWIIRCVIGVMGSCSLVALYGLYQNFFGTLETKWQDTDMFSQIEGRVVSTFENPNVLAEYLIMLLPLMLAMLILTKAPRVRLALLMASAVSLGCLIYTWSRGAWLGFMLGVLIFLLMYSRKTLTILLLGVLAVPFLPIVMPESIVQRFTSIGNLGDSSTSYRVNIWRGVIDMLGDYWHSGIGIGEVPFRAVYPTYSLEAIEAAPHSHNLYLQITVEIGIVGLVVFAAAMFLYMQGSLSLHAREQRRDKLISTAVFCGIIAVLAQGMTDYIWYNYRVFLMFWLLLGLGAAVRKTLTSTAAEDVF